MIRTHGLTHIAPAVRDLDRATRLVDPDDIGAAAEAVTAAGGSILEQGDFCPGEPYLFATDPDGHEVEIWYELPTPMDP